MKIIFRFSWLWCLGLYAIISYALIQYFQVSLKLAFLGPFAFAVNMVYERIKRSESRYIRKDEIKTLVKETNKLITSVSEYKIDEKKVMDKITNTAIEVSKPDIIHQVLQEVEIKDSIQRDAFSVAFLSVVILTDRRGTKFNKSLSLADKENLKKLVSDVIEKHLVTGDNPQSFQVALEQELNKINGDGNEYSVEYILQKYSPLSHIVQKLSLDKETAEAARGRLTKLIKDGRIPEAALLDSIKKTNISGNDTLDCFDVYMNALQKDSKLSARLANITTIRLGSEAIEGRRFSRRLMFLEAGIWTEKKIINELVKPCFDSAEVTGFIALKKLGKANPQIFPSKQCDDWNENIKKGWEIIKSEFSSQASVEDGNFTPPTVEKILTYLPLDIFVHGADKRIKDFIAAQYEVLKNHFELDKMTDWAAISPQELANKLIELDEKRKSETKKNRIARDDKWRALATNMIEEVKNHENALNALATKSV